MRRSIRLAIVGLSTLFVGCATGDERAATRPAVGGQPVPLAGVCLRDVQPLFGGRDLWVGSDRVATAQLAGGPHARGGNSWARRRTRTLTIGEWAEVERLVGSHHFLSLDLPDRPGVPDEARPRITVSPRGGPPRAVAKGANDAQPDFDAVYRYLVELADTEAANAEDVTYDWRWHPSGFDAEGRRSPAGQ